jgi:low temperature requirement protein LtrA
MVAGIVLVALGMKKTLGAVDEALETVTATALLGGTSVYLLAHVAFRLRNLHTLNKQRLVTAVLLVALIPVAVEIPSLATVTLVGVALSALIAYEAIRFREARRRIRQDEWSM